MLIQVAYIQVAYIQVAARAALGLHSGCTRAARGLTRNWPTRTLRGKTPKVNDCTRLFFRLSPLSEKMKDPRPWAKSRARARAAPPGGIPPWA